MQERTSQRGKGKPICSGDVLGNRIGERRKEKKKASEKISRMYEANKQKEEHGAVQGAGLQSGTVGFQKEFH